MNNTNQITREEKIEKVKNSETFQEAFQMLRKVNLFDKKEYEQKLWDILPKVASSQGNRRLWRGIRFGKSPYSRRKK